MKKLSLALLIAGTSILGAQKIAYVNTEEILTKMPEMNTARKNIESFRDAQQKKITDAETALQKEYQKFQEDAQNIKTVEEQKKKEAEFMKRQEAIQKKAADIDTLRETTAKAIQERTTQEFKAPTEKAQKTIDEVAQKGGYTYVLDARSLVHVGKDAVNLSIDVKKKLNIKD